MCYNMFYGRTNKKLSKYLSLSCLHTYGQTDWLLLDLPTPCRGIINYECGVQRNVLSIHKKLDCTPLFPPFVAPLSPYSYYIVANSCNVVAYSHYAVAYSH